MIALQWMGWVAALVCMGMLARMTWQRRHGYGAPSHYVDTLVGASSTSRPLRAGERQAYKLLLQSMPPDYFLLPQMALARFIKVSRRTSYRAWYEHIGHRCVDFLVCNAVGEVVAVIELDEHKPGNSGYGRVVQRKAKVLAASHVAVLHWYSEDLPELDEVSRQLETAEFGAGTLTRHANAVPSGTMPLANSSPTLPAPLASEEQEFTRRHAAQPAGQTQSEHVGDTVILSDLKRTGEEQAAISRRLIAVETTHSDDPWGGAERTDRLRASRPESAR